jgi:hypothetical protein
MTTLALLNGKRYDIKESADRVDEIVGSSEVWAELTLVRDNLSSNPKEEVARFMINAIAYWY